MKLVQVEFEPAVLEDFGRIFDFVASHVAASAPARIDEILEAIRILETSPAIGRPVGRGMRELIVGRGAYGYVVLYQYVEPSNLVFALAVRSQRESGYKHP